MAAPIEFNIRITGGAATELKATGAGFNEVDKGAKKAAEGVKVFEGEVGHLSGELGGLSINLQALSDGRGSLFAFDLAEGFRAAYEAASFLVEKVIDIGKEAVLAVAGAQDLNFALDKNLGTDGAREINEVADAMERFTRIDGDDVKSALLPLTEQGIGDSKLLGNISAAAADVAARRNTGTAGFRAYVDSLGDIAISGGKKIDGSLKTLGIAPREFYLRVGESIGKSAKETEALAKAGAFTNTQLLEMAVHLIDIREGGKGVGQTAIESAGTLGGIIDKLRAAPENLLKRLLGSEAMDAVQVKLEGILGALNGPAGVKLVERFGDSMAKAFNSVSTEDVIGALEFVGDVVGKIVKGLSLAIQLAADLNRIGEDREVKDVDFDGRERVVKDGERGERLEQAGVGIGSRILDSIGIGAGANDKILQAQLVREDIAGAIDTGRAFGTNYTDGAVDGIKGGTPKVQEAAVLLAQDTHAAASGPDGLDAHSPSRKGIALGRFYAQGVGLGMNDEAGSLALNATRTISQVVSAGPAGVSSSGGDSGPRQIVINLPGGGQRTTDASGPEWVRQMDAWLYREQLAAGAA